MEYWSGVESNFGVDTARPYSDIALPYFIEYQDI